MECLLDPTETTHMNVTIYCIAGMGFKCQFINSISICRLTETLKFLVKSVNIVALEYLYFTAHKRCPNIKLVHIVN